MCPNNKQHMRSRARQEVSSLEPKYNATAEQPYESNSIQPEPSIRGVDESDNCRSVFETAIFLEQIPQLRGPTLLQNPVSLHRHASTNDYKFSEHHLFSCYKHSIPPVFKTKRCSL